MKKIVIDLDETISLKNENTDYELAEPNRVLINKMQYFKEQGYTICIFTARNMRTYDGNIGRINKNTLPKILDWLKKYAVPFDEIIVGKPWCGQDGFYVDDRAIRPDEFINLSESEIQKLTKIK
jgi:capsule biosynthesis phosphatase